MEIDDDIEMLRKKRMEELMKQFGKGPAEQDGNRPSKPAMLNDASFDGFVKNGSLVVIDCYADWCMPCKMVTPIVEQLAREMKGVSFGKLDVDESQKTAMRYKIMSIPTLLVFKNGELIDTIVGALPKATLQSKIERYL